MAFDDDHTRDLFLEVYGTLPRAGPGGDEHTTRALELVPDPRPTSVLDLGCGPGAQTLTLAAGLPHARIVAVDLMPSMVAEARRRVARAGLQGRVEVVEGDMASPPVAPSSQDLIWCEGAIYNLGVSEALTAWRPLLATGGTVAFTEPVWLVESPPTEVHDWWAAEYPAISASSGVHSRVERAGYEVTATFVLPASSWWDEYYEPMRSALDGLRARRPDDPVAASIMAMAETEIDMWQRFSDCYSYAFFVVQPTAPSPAGDTQPSDP